MNPDTSLGGYLTASKPDGILIIHGSPVTLSWVPRDVVNDAYNVGGTVIVGTFDNVNAAKSLARDRYSASSEDWQVSEVLPFDISSGTGIEVHTPDVEGHKIVRHDIHWK
jgi:hypothetical protein